MQVVRTAVYTLPEHNRCFQHWTSYRLTCEQYEALIERSGQRCEICGVPSLLSRVGRLYIDHDGRLGNGFDHVRGLVCARCNSHLRYVDNGFRKPTPAQQRYLDNAWFWTGLPEHLRDEPWLPETCANYNCAAPRRHAPTSSADAD